MDPILPPLQPPSSFPAVTKQAAGYVDGVPTDVMSMFFADKIMVTVTQGGRLAQWIHVPLGSSNPNFADQHLPAISHEDSLLPLTHLTPQTLLGGSNADREIVGQLYATQIANIIATKDPQEDRTVVIGLGLRKLDLDREAFYDIVDLVRRCL
ncbi:MAG: hypothetical protein Q9190_003711 [Brigantiaea leucoxantha]